VRVINGIEHSASTLGVNYPEGMNLARYRLGLSEKNNLNLDGLSNEIKLLNGSASDSLGIDFAYTLLTSPASSPSFLNWLNTGKINKYLLIVINGGTSLNNDGLRLIARAKEEVYPNLEFWVVYIGIDLIADDSCRKHFENFEADWKLPRGDADDLVELSAAMILHSPSYQKAVTALGGRVPLPARSVEQLCTALQGHQ
jgi:hypothetical protein